MSDVSARWTQIQTLFEQALDQPADARTAWLRAVCGDDPELYAEIDRLLAGAAHGHALLDGGLGEALAPDELEAALVPSDAGEAVGPWRLGERIGVGGMGTVYRAVREGDFEQRAALKRIKRGMDSEAVLARFRAERQILARLEHPGIARLLDGGLGPDGCPYFAMELVEGEPITAWCDARRLGLDARLELFEQVCEAVAYAHRQLVVHRDLKPSNVLVTDGAGEPGTPTVKLLDFGIARVLSEDRDELTQTGQRVFTPGYAAPEQVRGQAPTTSTDVYALGALLYRLLSGARPIATDDRTAAEIELAVLNEAPPRPSAAVTLAAAAARGLAPDELAQALRGDLDTVCLKALRKEPERRYGSAAELLADVRRYREGFPIAARPATRRHRARLFVRRHRAGVAAAAVALAAILGGGGVALWQAAEARTQRDLALAEIESQAVTVNTIAGAFAAARIGVPGADTLRASTLLGSIADSVDGMSDVRARGLLSSALAAEYLERGDFDRVETLASLALEAPVPPIASALRIRADQHLALGIARVGRGDAEGAIGPLHEAVRLKEELLGPEDYEISEALQYLSGALSTLDDPGEALPLQRRAAEMARRLDADPARADSANTGRVSGRAYASLGGQLMRLGRTEEAAVALDTALAIGWRSQRTPAEIPSQAAKSRAELAVKAGDPAYALDVLAPVMEAMLPVYGPDFFAVWTLREVRGYARARLGDPDGIAELRAVYAWYASQYGPDSPALTRISAWLGEALLASEPEEARRLLDQAYALQGGEVTTFGGARTALFIAEAYAEAGDRARARPFARETLAFLEPLDAPELVRRARAAAG